MIIKILTQSANRYWFHIIYMRIGEHEIGIDIRHSDRKIGFILS